MKILKDRLEIKKAQADFASAIRAESSETIYITIGFQPGNTKENVLWLPKYNIWALFRGNPPLEKPPLPRFWNVFGIDKPSVSHSNAIVCEINPPHQGIDRQIAGAFAADSNGKISVVHRGRFNARGRVPSEFTRKIFNWKWTSITDGSEETDVMIIGTIGTSNFVRSLADFVVEVNRFKKIARTQPWK